MASRGLELVKAAIESTLKTNRWGPYLKNLEVLSAANGQCKAEFTVKEEQLNYAGSLHGGCVCSLVDCVSSYALLTQGKGHQGVSVNMNISFMKAAMPDEVITVEAKTMKLGRTLAFLDVELSKKKDGSLIARAAHTKFVGFD
ncbi:acyl-coenzyme A thioesterase 13-like [Microplitis mediator]|uniref:acyl-coenzyme A thioesterase 13-like n=1 Tax=Microplitis mediator TaxID=375433 RepID=UPI002557C4AC|nr:acyl-coenzyme A thioesterase 13-like [Microplitis mediator]